MKNLKVVTLIVGLFLASWTQAATLYVGVGAQCNASNHYDNLALALLEAAVNGSQNDEIRLTNTVNYIGGADGDNVLTDFNPANRGELTIVGGFANCNSVSSSGITSIGGSVGAVFDLIGQSVVTLRNLQLTGSQNRGLVVREGSSVFLESSDVSTNVAGIRVLGGGYVSVDEFSSISSNGDLDDIPKGGGIWCFENNSVVNVAGSVANNQAVEGGNIHVESGCSVILEAGAEIKGDRFGGFTYSAQFGGGIMINDGGELFAGGGMERVLITDHRAVLDGGGIYVRGTGRATLINTYIAGNVTERDGAGLFAIDGGTVTEQVLMDRANTCPNLISCSEFENNTFTNNVVHIENSKVRIQRTLFDRNQYFFNTFDFNGLVTVIQGGVLQMSHSNMINNEAHFLIENFSNSELSHITAVDNYTNGESGGIEDSFVWFSSLGNLRFENSIFQDTQGGMNAPTTSPNISGKCNLIDNSNDWPVGSFTIGTAMFNNVPGGDARQLASSDGVDMCQQDTFAWSIDRDIEYQVSPVNEATNPQGDPGESGGLYDAGFDEVYDNIGDDEFLLTVQKEGSGEGFVISDPLGISCGSDCTEVVFNGTLVTLSATATGNSEFIGWRSCPLVNGSNECLISVTESTTVFAEFQPDDLIFSDNFE
ncbi:hypothetical protein OS175_08415 [Marinicella sp. S1101]|uniref:hypothetical protein n=1 Tax=Marinicella marina TaxID=2996016 RepID=UPI002260D0DE|nr:hypothetical protein [Marinicella marina]MCX7553900.1 hypothetical protein [Marinicella marina]MDJ1140392.1 hypothetical protein [Marinicella marina]